MPMLRGNALRSLQSSLRYSGARATVRATAPARTQLISKRFASSGGHGDHATSSDLPWMIGALVVTPVSMWYLWPAPHDDHHEGHGHEEHGEDAEEEEPSEEEDKSSQEEDKPSEEDQAPEDEAPQAEAAPQEQADDSEEGNGEKKEAGEKKSSDDEGGEEGGDEGRDEDKESGAEMKSGSRGVGKGKMAEGSAGRIEERKSEPRPAKGSNVKRIDSGLGKNLGEGPTHEDEDPNKKETQATSKEPSKDPGDVTTKQKGLSTTDTRHSLQIDQDPEKSKKGSGEPETAKAKGTVDPKAPVR